MGNVHRLPETVRPVKYAIELRPDLEKFTFAGHESIAIRVLEADKAITLNAEDLAVTEATLRLPNGKALPAAQVDHQAASKRVRLSFASAIPKGEATLSLTFTGTLNDQLAGFYRSKYTTADGKEGYMAATQFEPTDARRAFPCWDEPDAKATFEVALVVPAAMAAVSNMPIVREEDLEEGWKRIRFAETPRMSTYLLAFVVGPLKAVEGAAKIGTKIGVWALPDRVRHGRWALESASGILDYLNAYYGVPYPLEKLDHVALQDFAAGAMENWGAITYRERILLFDPSSSSAQTRQNIVDVIAHETAHMWFGDLVTMAWWDDLWLNESFASWVGTKAVDALHPEWQMWTQFLYGDVIRGLGLDGLRSSHPIEVPVEDPAQIGEIFDEISYSKGASILRMLEQYLGEDPFRRGIRDYLVKHSYGNARTVDLWKALGKASGEPVQALMRTWVGQTGFPLIDVRTARKDDGATLKLSQSRFLYEHIVGVSDTKTRWQVPVQVLRAGAPEATKFLMDGRTATHSFRRTKPPRANDWIKVNAGQSGFYRVNYPPDEWDRLRRAVEAGELEARDRLGLLNDAYALTLAGYLPATTFLELTSAYGGEDDASVWRTIADSLRGFEALIADQPYLESFYGYARDVFNPIVRKVGWDAKPGEGHLDALLRMTVLARLGYYGDGAVLSEVKDRFAGYLKSPASLSPDLRGVVYNLVSQESDEATYETLWDLERKSVLQEEKVRLLLALASPRQSRLLQRTLARSLSDEVRSQDAVLVITNAASYRPNVGRDLAWKFIEKNWKELHRRYAPSGFLIRRLAGVAESFASLDRAKSVTSFFKSHPSPEVRRTVQQAVERIRVNAKWLERNGKDLAAWFRKR